MDQLNFTARYPMPLSGDTVFLLPKFVLSIPILKSRPFMSPGMGKQLYVDRRIDVEEIKKRERCLFIERHVTKGEIKKRNAVASSNWRGINRLLGGGDLNGFQPLSETVSEVKEQCVKKDIKKLGKLIKRSLKDQLKELGVRKDNPRLRQEIIEPLMFLDLYPGDTKIHYLIFTIGRLVLINGSAN